MVPKPTATCRGEAGFIAQRLSLPTEDAAGVGRGPAALKEPVWLGGALVLAAVQEVL